MMRTSFKYDDEDEIQVSGNPYQFHSRAGKVRLSRIWSNLNLSKELLVSTWTAGHREALLRDRVTDYLYNFLQARFKRFGSKNKFELEYSASKKSGIRKTKNLDTNPGKPEIPNFAELEYEKHLKEQSKKKMDAEGKRIIELYITGDLPLPHHLKKINKDPVYRLNMLNKRLEHLERDYEDRLENPILYESVKTLKQNKQKCEQMDDRCSTAAQVEESIFNIQNEDGRASSGFHEPTPSPHILESTLLKRVSEEEDSALDTSDAELHEESLANAEINHEDSTFKISKHLKEENDDSVNHDDSIDDPDSDLLGIEMETVWISPLVKFALNQHTTATRFEESEKVLSIFRRKLVRSEVFTQDLGLFLNNYFD